MKTATENAARKPVKETKAPDFAERLASLSDAQLRKLKKLIDDALKDREGKGSILGQMSDSEFNALKDDLTEKAEKSKKGAA